MLFRLGMEKIWEKDTCVVEKGMSYSRETYLDPLCFGFNPCLFYVLIQNACWGFNWTMYGEGEDGGSKAHFVGW